MCEVMERSEPAHAEGQRGQGRVRSLLGVTKTKVSPAQGQTAQPIQAREGPGWNVSWDLPCYR